MAILRRRRSARARRSPARRRIRRLTVLGTLVAGAAALRNKKIEENRQRFNLP